MKTFDHIGMTTDTERLGERYVMKTKVWVTDPQLHPFKIEWLRYEEDSPVPGKMRDACHVAWRVDSIERESEGLKVLIAPFSSVAGHVVGFFETEDGAIVELMEY